MDNENPINEEATTVNLNLSTDSNKSFSILTMIAVTAITNIVVGIARDKAKTFVEKLKEKKAAKEAESGDETEIG